jgi:hypothetical protein
LNQNWNLFTDKRKIFEAGLSWCKARLDEPHFKSKLDEIVTLRKWETEQFRRLVRAGKRWEAEQRFLAGIHGLRGKAFDLVVNKKIIAARLFEVRRKARTGEGLREIDEDRLRHETLIEFNNGLRENPHKAIPVR